MIILLATVQAAVMVVNILQWEEEPQLFGSEKQISSDEIDPVASYAIERMKK